MVDRAPSGPVRFHEMASTVVPPPATRRWTRVEYERLIELGVFQPGERLELIDGLLVVREPQGSRHAAAIRRVLAALRRVLGDAWQIDSQLPIALDDASQPEPDVAVVPGDPTAYRDAHPSRAVLIVEIAETSYRVDREYKASLYARAGIPDCWIVDLLHAALEVHREPEASSAALYGWRYRTIETLRPPAAVTPRIAPDRSIPIADLLP
jgi:Uma2 family endonuclease